MSANGQKRVYPSLVCAAALSIWPAASQAANLEPAGINLGGTSFYDGFGRNEEGFTYLVYAQYGRARSIMQDDGTPSPYFQNPKIDAYLLLNQLAYTLPEKLFGDSAHLGISFIVPIVAFNTSFDPGPPFPAVQLKDNGFGLGDLTFGPFLQFRPIMADGRPVFSTRIGFDIIAPTGKYDPNMDINQGSNFTSLNPSIAATVLPIPHLELSVRLNYLYNFKNVRPALGYLYGLQVPPAVKDARAGQAGWLNFAASYEVVHPLHVGVNGYYFQQLNLDLWEMQDGSSNPGTSFADNGKLRFLGIGPGAMFDFGEHDKLFANVYFQTMVHNGAESTVFNLHYIHGF